jgi:hypothetical protein
MRKRIQRAAWGREVRSPQFWLAELDQYDNPTLIDGSHDSPDGANKAAYLIRAMRLGKPERRFAVAKVELSVCVPSAKGVNHEAVRAINTMRRRASDSKEPAAMEGQ